MKEYPFTCVHCWQTITALVDVSQSQTYIEDCEVCCNPMLFKVICEQHELISFEVLPIEQ